MVPRSAVTCSTGGFIVRKERSQTRLCEIFDLLLELKRKRNSLGDGISKRLAELLSLRFDKTASSLLAQLAYLFTPKGLVYFRDIFSALDFEGPLETQDYQRRLDLRDALMREFVSLYGYFGFTLPHIRVPPLFHQFLNKA